MSSPTCPSSALARALVTVLYPSRTHPPPFSPLRRSHVHPQASLSHLPGHSAHVRDRDRNRAVPLLPRSQASRSPPSSAATPILNWRPTHLSNFQTETRDRRVFLLQHPTPTHLTPRQASVEHAGSTVVDLGNREGRGKEGGESVMISSL